MLTRLLRRILLAELIVYGLIAWAATAADALAAAAIPALVLGLGAFGRLGYIVNSAVAAGLFRGGRIGGALRMLPGEWAALVLAHTVLQPLRPQLHRWLPQTPPPEQSGPDVLYVHGYCCNAAFWLPLFWRLRGRAHRRWTIDLEPVFGDIDDLADGLADRIRAIPENPDAPGLIIVAHSMGGLVARACLKRHPALKTRVRELLTVGTPHAGTRLAMFGFGENARQMRPASPWLAALNETPPEVPCSAIAGCADEIIAPQASAEPDFAGSVHRVTGTGHMMLAWHRAVRDHITRAIAVAPAGTTGD